eukprot:1139019-Pelagomonas_calceolata.AAC.7
MLHLAYAPGVALKWGMCNENVVHTFSRGNSKKPRAATKVTHHKAKRAEEDQNGDVSPDRISGPAEASSWALDSNFNAALPSNVE